MILVRPLAVLAVLGVVVGVLGGLASLVAGGLGPKPAAGIVVLALVLVSVAAAAVVGARDREWRANVYW